MRASVSKRLKVWNREIYEKIQGWDTKQANHKKLEREKILARANYPPYQKRRNRDP